MNALLGLQCHLCKANFPAEATYVCTKCLGPLEPVYDYRAITVTPTGKPPSATSVGTLTHGTPSSVHSRL